MWGSKSKEREEKRKGERGEGKERECRGDRIREKDKNEINHVARRR